MKREKVFFYETSRRRDRISAGINAGFDEFKMQKRLESISTVFIKPNLVTDVVEYIRQGANTDILVIEAVLEYLQKYKHLKVYLGESETGTKSKGRRLAVALERMGVMDLKKKFDFEIVNLTHDKQVKVKIPKGVFVKELMMGKTLMEADLVINLPKIKTHKYSIITCALKNMFGTIPNPMRVMYHQNIHQVLADLNSLFYEKMFIVTDGLVGMEGDGPIYGYRRKLNLLMFATNPIAHDAATAKMMKLDVSSISHINLANLWGKVNLDNIELTGDASKFDKLRPFVGAHPNLFVKTEGYLMQFPWIVRILLNDWIRSHITYYFNPILKKFRGGSYSWYK